MLNLFSVSFVTWLHQRANEDVPVLWMAANMAVCSLISLMSRAWIYGLNRFSASNGQSLVDAIESRPSDQALITVSNHTCSVDDPVLFAMLLPLHIYTRPMAMRWALCSQEHCYKNGLLAACFGAGQVLPIERGAGIDQKALLDVSRRVAAGQWIHVFPEGGICQTNRLTGRLGWDGSGAERARKIGRLKWGVAKLIAHAPTPPLVIPFYHVGMAGIFEQVSDEPGKNGLKSWIPGIGKDISVTVGDPIDFSDIVEQHRARWTQQQREAFDARVLVANVANDGDFAGRWRSAVHERDLYSAITWRIEHRLMELEGTCVEGRGARKGATTGEGRDKGRPSDDRERR